MLKMFVVSFQICGRLFVIITMTSLGSGKRPFRYKRIQPYRTDLQEVSGPIRIKLKSYFQGKLFIFRANCYFQSKFFRPRPPVKCLPVRQWLPVNEFVPWHAIQLSQTKRSNTVVNLSSMQSPLRNDCSDRKDLPGARRRVCTLYFETSCWSKFAFDDWS